MKSRTHKQAAEHAWATFCTLSNAGFPEVVALKVVEQIMDRATKEDVR